MTPPAPRPPSVERRLTLVPRAGFNWRRVTWGRPDSVPTAICSYCAGGLPEVPLILMKQDGHVARFCDTCIHRWWGFK